MTFPYIYLFCKLQHVDAVVLFPRSPCGIILSRAEFKIHTGLVQCYRISGGKNGNSAESFHLFPPGAERFIALPDDRRFPDTGRKQSVGFGFAFLR